VEKGEEGEKQEEQSWEREGCVVLEEEDRFLFPAVDLKIPLFCHKYFYLRWEGVSWQRKIGFGAVRMSL
jgi:hypothetical protein